MFCFLLSLSCAKLLTQYPARIGSALALTSFQEYFELDTRSDASAITGAMLGVSYADKHLDTALGLGEAQCPT